MPMCGQRTVKSRHSRVREMSMQNPNMRKAKSQAWQGWQPGNPSGRRERLFLAFRQAWKKRLSEGRCTERSRNGQARNPGNRNVYRGGRPDGRRRQGIRPYADQDGKNAGRKDIKSAMKPAKAIKTSGQADKRAAGAMRTAQEAAKKRYVESKVSGEMAEKMLASTSRTAGMAERAMKANIKAGASAVRAMAASAKAMVSAAVAGGGVTVFLRQQFQRSKPGKQGGGGLRAINPKVCESVWD